MSFLLGIDYGTGGGKAVLIDDQGEVLGYGFSEYPIYTDTDGRSEHDAEKYWSVAGEVVRKALSEAELKIGKAVPAAEIRGIAVSSALPSMVMVDKDCRPLARAYNLMDRRAKNEVEWLKENIGEDRIFEISANRLDDHPIIVNLLWERNNRPEVYRSIHKVLTIDGFITARLTGQYVCHYSGAAFYGVAYRLREKSFDKALLEKLGVSDSILPGLCSCQDKAGELTVEAAEYLGLVPGIPVAGGQVDCNAGWIGAGALEQGDIQMNLGTAGNFGIIHDGSYFDSSMINFAYSVDSENTYITVPTTTTGGQLIRYMRDNFYRAELEAERSGSLNNGKDTFDLINEEAAAVSPGSEGLVVLPFLMGERTPIWDVYARGTIFGLSLHHGRGHVVRAMMESVAFALFDSYRILSKSGMKINSPIVLNEGGAKSVLWRSIITDVFNTPTVLVESRVGAPYGDAVLAGVMSGVFRDFSIAGERASYIEPMEPDAARNRMYSDYFNLYKSIYNNLKEDFRTLADLRSRKYE